MRSVTFLSAPASNITANAANNHKFSLQSLAYTSFPVWFQVFDLFVLFKFWFFFCFLFTVYLCLVTWSPDHLPRFDFWFPLVCLTALWISSSTLHLHPAVSKQAHISQDKDKIILKNWNLAQWTRNDHLAFVSLLWRVVSCHVWENSMHTLCKYYYLAIES